MSALNVLGTALQACSFDPLTGFFRDGSCCTGPEDLGSHTICAVVTTTNKELPYDSTLGRWWALRASSMASECRQNSSCSFSSTSSFGSYRPTQTKPLLLAMTSLMASRLMSWRLPSSS